MWAQQEQRSSVRIVSGAKSLKSPGNRGRGIGEGWGMLHEKGAISQNDPCGPSNFERDKLHLHLLKKYPIFRK